MGSGVWQRGGAGAVFKRLAMFHIGMVDQMYISTSDQETSLAYYGAPKLCRMCQRKIYASRRLFSLVDHPPVQCLTTHGT